MDNNYIKKQAQRMRDFSAYDGLYKDACFRLLSNADAIPPTYPHEGHLTASDIEKAEQIAAKALGEV